MQVSALDDTFLNNRKLRHVNHKFGSAEFANVSSADTFLCGGARKEIISFEFKSGQKNC